ncbi:MAG: WYL domain-containing protein [Levilactobacillus sp.]|jgi:predicted DNA-binding transcriptional regulator YafY|uniref:helix-turn-helix transcriptional regulator n=1 Tax=Levilactobacillus sp. TaxID=2767919 RepID=UPI00258E25BA|nr:WYL domain-containing protein [Levilactobacillus sp.]MCI1552940.1 WYL domain-containing protein [Levilactobacillus sp.]MCI1598080.1 WYL domain-containing protein [Levilactobacillus sp.]MCI1606086.1 WYL domain-containing protein [Levilactobacillus sp.]
MKSQERVINILLKLINGEKITIDAATTDHYQVTERTLQRDIKVIRDAVNVGEADYQMQHDTTTGSYHLAKGSTLATEEVLALLKMVIGTRSLTTTELLRVKDHLVALVTADDQPLVEKLIDQTLKDYTPLFSNGDREILPRLRSFSKWIAHQTPIAFSYRSSVPNRQGETIAQSGAGIPLSVYFADFYFYVVMYLPDRDKSLNYRLDRFEEAHVAQDSGMTAPNAQRLAAGSLTHLLTGTTDTPYEFRYWGYPQTALDQLPNARITSWEDDGSVIIKGDHLASRGTLLWVMSQGAQIQVKAPQKLALAVKRELAKALRYY